MKAKTLFSRAGTTFLAVLIELVFLLLLLAKLRPYLSWVELILRVLSVFIVLAIINYSRRLSSDLMWVVLIMLMPVGGTVIFLFLEVMERFDTKTYTGLKTETEIAATYYTQDAITYQKALSDNRLRDQYRYIRDHAGFSIYENTGFDYYPLGELGFEAMKEEMRKAKKFIFLEYFIITPGEMWDSMLEIMKEKVREGVEVRILYDDLGSMNTLPAKYTKVLESYGIKAQAFNRVNQFLSGIMNHRDHRKIMVIDGTTAFSGGINLADEYINTKVAYGHWKDNCIRIKGEAVWSYTVMFLTTWNALRHEDSDYTIFKNNGALFDKEQCCIPDGFIAPYGETPLDDDLVGENIYLNILNNAKDYCYIMTPYLIIDSDLTNALILAAQRGVDVRIITPGIPDKKIIWRITRSHYFNLIHGGVKIYEYTPGFIHSKVFVSDDIVATVGTLNLDYRSLYLHFENGTALFSSSKIMDIKEDFTDTCAQSHLVSEAESYKNFLISFFFMVLRIFSPMM